MEAGECSKRIIKEGTLYERPPAFILKHLEKYEEEKRSSNPNDFVVEFLKKHTSDKKQVKEYVPLGAPAHLLKKTKRSKKRKACLTSKERRSLKIFDIDKNSVKFKDFLGLHAMWKEYAFGKLNIDKENARSSLIQRLLRADLHGCWIVVCASASPTLIGASGIIIQETKNTFKVVTEDDKLKIIPKLHSIFAFKVAEMIIKIHGTNFRSQPFMRSKAKFKTRCDDDI